MTPTCPYCGAASHKVTGREIYPHRPDLFGKTFYLCAPCDAYVGCHPGGDVPLGRLADASLRRAKQAAHAAFDPLWKNASYGMKRRDAYRWLRAAMSLSEDECHIGLFDVEQCRRVVALCKERKNA